MKYIFYDCETTGLTRKDEVIQFACFVADENLKLLRCSSFYCFTQVPISDKARKVHGIDSSTLRRYSNGFTFEENFYKIEELKESDLVWVAYSNGNFDARLINQTLTHNGGEKFNFGEEVPTLGVYSGIHYFDVYKLLKARVFGNEKKLSAALKSTGMDVDALFLKVTGKEASFHDALYDSFSLYLLTWYYRDKLGMSDL